MAYSARHPSEKVHQAPAIASAFVSAPTAFFGLALVMDIAFWQTGNLMWLHFSEWLLLAGLTLGILAIAAWLMGSFVWRWPLSWSGALGALVVLVLATLNNFIHTADGWTAVVPWGLTLSALTLVAIVVTVVVARWESRHV